MSEMAMAERAQNIPKPDLSKINIEKRIVYQGANGYQRYEGNSLSPMPVPGGPGSYIANGSEHDGMGDTTHLGQRHVEMTERRFGKLRLLEDGTFESENESESIALVPWGGTKGPAKEAFDQLSADGIPIGWYYTMFLNPLPPMLLEDLLRKDLVIVPELNYQGQWASMLRSYGIKAKAITQYTGLPFKVRDLVQRVKELVDSHHREAVQV